MNDIFKGCEITEEDLRAALSGIKGYVDITVEDLILTQTCMR